MNIHKEQYNTYKRKYIELKSKMMNQHGGVFPVGTPVAVKNTHVEGIITECNIPNDPDHCTVKTTFSDIIRVANNDLVRATCHHAVGSDVNISYDISPNAIGVIANIANDMVDIRIPCIYLNKPTIEELRPVRTQSEEERTTELTRQLSDLVRDVSR